MVRVPLAAFDAPAPRPGTRWRMDLYRCDQANRGSLAWRPVLQPSSHAAERFGVLELAAER